MAVLLLAVGFGMGGHDLIRRIVTHLLILAARARLDSGEWFRSVAALGTCSRRCHGRQSPALVGTGSGEGFSMRFGLKWSGGGGHPYQGSCRDQGGLEEGSR
jgi:hypothetical protein